MISQMKKYTFLVFHRDYEPFLEQLRELGVVHITEKAAGLIEDDETLQAALQHEDALRHLLRLNACWLHASSCRRLPLCPQAWD